MNKHIKSFLTAIIIFLVFIIGVVFVASKMIIPQMLNIGDTISTPNIEGMSYQNAKDTLLAVGFDFDEEKSVKWVNTADYSADQVITQIPRAGKIVKRGSFIKIEASLGAQMVVIPSIIEVNVINALSQLKQVNLKAEIIKEKTDELYVINDVFKVEPQCGQRVEKNSVVTLFIATDTLPYKIKDIRTSIDSLAKELINIDTSKTYVFEKTNLIKSKVLMLKNLSNDQLNSDQEQLYTMAVLDSLINIYDNLPKTTSINDDDSIGKLIDSNN